MLAIKLEIAIWAEEHTQKINWGYGPCTVQEGRVTPLIRYWKVIRRYYDNMRRNDMMCLCDDEFQRVREKVLRLVSLRKCKENGVKDITYDDSGLNAWKLMHPRCIGYDEWEKHLLGCVKPTLQVKVIKEKESPKRTLHALVTAEGTESEHCVMELLAYANEYKCENISAKFSADLAVCKRELHSLVEMYKCDLNLKSYATLKECGLSMKAVASILGCGGKFGFGPDGQPIVKLGTKVSMLNDLVELSGGTWPGHLTAEIYDELYD